MKGAFDSLHHKNYFSYRFNPKGMVSISHPYKNLKKFMILALFVISCQVTNNRDKNQIITFNLREFPKISTIKLSELGFVDIKYIPLETTDQSIISRINEIKIGDGFFLIKLFNTILKYQDDGSFITKIGRVGRGPDEFTVAHDVDIDNKNQYIYIVSAWQKKFIVYSENGEFLRTFHCPQNTTNFKITEEGILCYSINSFANVETSYNLIDTGGRIIKSFPNMYPYNGNPNTTIFEENLFYRFKNRLFKKEIYSDTVYVFEKISFKPHLAIEHGEKLLTTKARSNSPPLLLLENFISQKNLFEFGDYIYYEFMYDFKIGSYNVLRGLIGSKKNNFQFLINSEIGLINDLDGGPNIWPKTIKDDETLISWIDAIKLKNHVISDAFINSTPKYPEKKKELEKLANSLKETDNPVLMLVRLKR